MSPVLRLGWLYPTLMSTYGDRGNLTCLRRRAEWRDVATEVVPLDREATADAFAQVDIVVGGGAQDRQQELVMRDLQGEKAIALKAALDDGTPGVFTCGSPQLLGHYYEPGVGQRIDGLGVLDLVTVHPGPDADRCIGNVVLKITAPQLATDLQTMLGRVPYVIGFENHGGRTKLQSTEAFAEVIKGYGNNGTDGTEGAFHQNAIATYSHGPLLPKNPFLADWLLTKALERKTGETITLSPLDDSWAAEGRAMMLKRLGVQEPA